MESENIVRDLDKRLQEQEKLGVKQNESLKSAHKRIDKNEALFQNIHDLTAAIQKLTYQLQTQNERMDKMIDNFDERMDKMVDNVDERMKDQGERIGELEKKSGKKWEAAVEKVVITVIGIVVLYLFSQVGM